MDKALTLIGRPVFFGKQAANKIMQKKSFTFIAKSLYLGIIGLISIDNVYLYAFIGRLKAFLDSFQAGKGHL